jgi:predicted O-methyltransferase YrrM
VKEESGMQQNIGFTKALIWFIKRPKYYLELLRTLKGFALKRFVRAHQIREVKDWCLARSVTNSEAIEQLFGKQIGKSVGEMFKEVFCQAHETAEKCPVKMGGAANLDLLYNIVENSGARKVIETGVAYGWSSLALLLSITTREESVLVSTDMPYINRSSADYVGCVVPGRLRSNWEIIAGPDKFSLPQALEKVPAIDLCHYDSDKSYNGRMWAYELLWDALKPGGYFISDDIGDNLAFRDFCNRVKKEPVIVQSTSEVSRKYVGILVKDDSGIPEN